MKNSKLLFAAPLALIVLMGAGCTFPECIKSHTVHHHEDAVPGIEGRWTWVYSFGHGMNYVYIPGQSAISAKDWDENVCDQWSE